MKKLILFLILPFFIGCSSTKILKFTKKPDDIVKTTSLTNFLKDNKNPKVVLRVPQNAYTVTESERNEAYFEENQDYLYNAIENQLLSSGFIVRDRQLFNQIVENEDNNIDYKQLKDKSDTELIIELIEIDPSILYETNKYYDNKNNEKVDKFKKRRRYGASIEFKIVMISTNEFAGVYKFNYTPCVEGCVISTSYKDQIYERNKKKGEKGYEGVEKNILEDFVKNATKQLVDEMRK